MYGAFMNFGIGCLANVNLKKCKRREKRKYVN